MKLITYTEIEPKIGWNALKNSWVLIGDNFDFTKIPKNQKLCLLIETEYISSKDQPFAFIKFGFLEELEEAQYGVKYVWYEISEKEKAVYILPNDETVVAYRILE